MIEPRFCTDQDRDRALVHLRMSTRLLLVLCTVGVLFSSQGMSAPLSPQTRAQLARGQRLLERHQRYEAATLLLELAQRQASAELLYWAGRALWSVGQRSSAEQRFLAALVDDPAGPAGRSAVAYLTRNLAAPLPSALVERLATVTLQRLPAKQAAALHHRLALHYLRRTELPRAEVHLQRVTSSPAALYLRAVITLRLGEIRAARRLLFQARRMARQHHRQAVVELASLALARLDGAADRAKEAIAGYLTLPPDSPYYMRARQELAWAYLQAGDPGRALAQTAVLAHPQLPALYRPDQGILTGAALLMLCRRAEAQRVLEAARRQLITDMQQITRFVRPRAEMRLYYVDAMAAAARRSHALSEQLSRALFADAGFHRAYVIIRRLQRERAQLLTPAAVRLRPLLASELDRALVHAQHQGGQIVARLFEALLTELKDLRLQGEELLFESSGQSARTLTEPRTAAPQTLNQARRGRPRPVQTITHHGIIRWSFSREYWTDEMNSYTVHLPTACP